MNKTRAHHVEVFFFFLFVLGISHRRDVTLSPNPPAQALNHYVQFVCLKHSKF